MIIEQKLFNNSFSQQLLVLVEYYLGVKLFIVKNHLEIPAQIRNKKNLRHELGRWYSLPTKVYSRVTDTALLMLFLIYPDRDMKFTRWTNMLDAAILKVDVILSETAYDYLEDRRLLLLTVKKLFNRFTANFNFNDDTQPKVSLRIVFKFLYTICSYSSQLRN